MELENTLKKIAKILQQLIEDIHSVMAILKDKLDFVYLRKWAKKQNSLKLLEEMINLI